MIMEKMMRERIKYLMGKKAFHISMLIVILVIILFTVGIIILKYNVEGETNMPFCLNKVTIVSSVEGTDKDAGENRWAFDISQNNDFYFYIQKNKSYEKQEAIKEIVIDNIIVQKENEKGTINFYRPNTTESGGNYKNTQENLIQSIEYKGALETNLKNLEISNQGGIAMFRYANDNIAEYISNDEEIKHNELLQKAGISEEDLKAKISIDMTIKIESGKEYKTNTSFDLPIEGVVENGTSSKEIIDTSDIIFKRIKN